MQKGEQMARYIDADLIEEFIENEYLKTNGNDSYVLFALGYMAGAISKTPTADVVEVVRCKGCKYNCFNAEAGIAKCCMFCSKTNLYGFCYLGERRTDERHNLQAGSD